MTPIIRAESLSKRFQRPGRCFSKRTTVRALDEISFELSDHTILGLVGHNGAGKSSLLKILATVLLPDHGNISILDMVLPQEQEQLRAHIGYVIAEERSFYWRLSGRQNLYFFGALNGMTQLACDTRVTELMPHFDLGPDLLAQHFSAYSSGNKKKLALMRALLHRPRILLLDEPTRSLDPGVSHRFQHYVQQAIQSQELSAVLWASHDFLELENCADQLMLLDHGRIERMGDTASCLDDIRRHFEHSLEQP